MNPERCHLCKKFLVKQEVFVISNIIVERGHLFSWVGKKDNVTPVSFYFCRDCWATTAGPEYLSEYKDGADK